MKSVLLGRLPGLLLLFLWTFYYVQAFRKSQPNTSSRSNQELAREDGPVSFSSIPFLSTWDFLGHYWQAQIASFWPDSSENRTRQAMEICCGLKDAPRLLARQKILRNRDLFLLAGFFPLCLGNAIAVLLCLALLVLRYALPTVQLKRKAHQRVLVINKSLPTILNRLLLSLQAGSLLTDAWGEVACSDEGPLFEEMRAVSERVKEGISYTSAFSQFAGRYPLDSLRELGRMMAEGLRLGSKEVTRQLEGLRKRALNRHRRNLLEESDRANQKMMGPSLLLFISILLLVLAPLLNGGLL